MNSCSKKLIALAALGLGMSAFNAHAVNVDTEGGLMVGNVSDPYWFQVGAVAKIDGTVFKGSNQDKGTQFRSGGNIRDLSLDINGGIGPDLSYTIGFSTGTDSRITLEDAYVTYSGLNANNFDVSFGQVNPGYSLENTASSKWIHFRERSMASTAFTPSPGIGVSINTWDHNYSLIVSATVPKHGERYRNGNGTNPPVANKADRMSYSARATYMPFHDGDRRFQVGLSGFFTDNNSKNLTIQALPEARSRNTTAAITTNQGTFAAPVIMTAKSYSSADVEVLAQSGPLSFEAEYNRAHVNRTGAQRNLNFNGYHATVGYVLTGESRQFKESNGTFSRIIPDSCKGAWEIAARTSYVNMNSRDIRGGSAHNLGVVASWIANKHVRVIGEFINHKGKETVTHRKRNLKIVGVRLQVVV